MVGCVKQYFHLVRNGPCRLLLLLPRSFGHCGCSSQQKEHVPLVWPRKKTKQKELPARKGQMPSIDEDSEGSWYIGI